MIYYLIVETTSIMYVSLDLNISFRPIRYSPIHKISFCIDMSANKACDTFRKAQIFKELLPNFFMCSCSKCCSYIYGRFLQNISYLGIWNKCKILINFQTSIPILPSFCPDSPWVYILSICLSMPTKWPISWRNAPTITCNG